MCDPLQELNNAVDTLGDAGQKIIDAGVDTVDRFVENPLPVIATIALTYYLGPEGAAVFETEGTAAIMANAVVTAANGGNMEQIAVAAATSYVGGKIGEAAGSALPPETSKIVKQVVTSASGSAAVTALQGGSLKDVVTAGLTSSVSAYVSASLTQQGFSKVDKQLLSNASAAATKAILKGKSISEAIGSSVAATAISATISGDITKINQNNELGKGLQKTYDETYSWAKGIYDDYLAPSEKVVSEQRQNIVNAQNDYIKAYGKLDAAYQSYLKNKDHFENYETAMVKDGFRHVVIQMLGVNKWVDDTGAGREPPTKDSFLKAANADAKNIKELSGGVELAKATYDLVSKGYDQNLADLTEMQDTFKTGAWSKVEEAAAKIDTLNTEQTALVKSVGENVAKYEEQLKSDAADLAEEIGAEAAKTAKNELVAIDKGFLSYADQQDAGDDKAADYYAKKEGFNDAIEKVAANKEGYTDPVEYRQYISPDYTAAKEVNQMIHEQLGRDATPEEIAQYKGPTSNAESEKKIAEYADPLKTTEDEVIDFFKENIGREPTAAEVAEFVGYTPEKSTLTKENAEDKLINGLDLPSDYKFPDLKTAVSFGDAFSAARSAYGPNATFTWTDPKTGIERTYITGTQEEVKKNSIGDYDALTYKYVTKQMLDGINDPNLNPADLTKSEMNKFIESFANATPEQRQKMLTGTDSMTYKAINSMLGQALPNAKFTPDTVGTGTLKESDFTNYKGILKTAANTAAADIAGLAVRGVQAIGDVFGLDTATLAKAQDLLTKDKDTMMSKLVGNEKAVAGGLASGVESAVAYTLGGPAAAIGSLTGIAANNAWIEGEKAGLSTEENMQRTAVMATLEAAGEAVGLPGLSRLMKGVPAGATADQIVAYAKNAGLALGNEQISELATTAAQFAVDKWASYGLGKNATMSDFTDALKDTAVSTVFAVGSAGSVGAATRALKNTSAAPTEVIRTEVTPEVAWKRATDAGMTAEDLSSIKSAVQASINNGDMTTTQAKDAVVADLKDLGFTDQEASRIANTATADVVESEVSKKLIELNVPSDQLDILSGAITNQVMSGQDLKTSVNAVGQELQKTTGMDSTESLLAANKILTGMDVTNEVNNTLSTYNYNATPEQVNAMILANVGSNKTGLATNVVQTKASEILKNSGLSEEAAAALAPQVANSVLSGEGLNTSVSTLADQIAKATGQDTLTSSIIANEALTGSNLKTDITGQLESMKYTPTEQEISDLIGQNLTTNKADLNTKVGEYVDPRYVDQQEAIAALQQNLAMQITPEQLLLLTGQYSESELPQKAISSVVAGNIASEQEAEAEKQKKAAIASKGLSALSMPSVPSSASGAKQFGQPSVPNQSATPSPLTAASMLAPTFLSSKGVQEKFQDPLAEFQRLQDQPYAGENQYEGIAPEEPTQEQPLMNDAYYNYGQNPSIEDIMNPNPNLPDWANAANQSNIMQPGGLVANMYAAGGATGTRHGRYAHGGLSTPLMAAGGKMRVDFRHGDAVTGPGDGQSDDIPAMLADGEFVFPADVVAAIGNGSTKAGSDKLYDMMHGIRAHARSTKPQDLPPEIKSPLDFLKTKPSKARRK